MSRLPASGVPNKIIGACLRLRPDNARLDDPLQAAKLALHSIARRAAALRDEAAELDREIRRLVAAAAESTMATFAMGPDTAASLLVTVGDNPERLRCEAAFADCAAWSPFRLCRARPSDTG